MYVSSLIVDRIRNRYLVVLTEIVKIFMRGNLDFHNLKISLQSHHSVTGLSNTSKALKLSSPDFREYLHLLVLDRAKLALYQRKSL